MKRGPRTNVKGDLEQTKRIAYDRRKRRPGTDEKDDLEPMKREICGKLKGTPGTDLPFHLFQVSFFICHIGHPFRLFQVTLYICPGSPFHLSQVSLFIYSRSPFLSPQVSQVSLYFSQITLFICSRSLSFISYRSPFSSLPSHSFHQFPLSHCIKIPVVFFRSGIPLPKEATVLH
jgi:hypothetical protein